jgi:hypothetical protein
MIFAMLLFRCLFIAGIFGFLGCAAQPPAPETVPPAPVPSSAHKSEPKTVANPTPAPSPAEPDSPAEAEEEGGETEGSETFIERSELRRAISEWLEAHPQASYAEATRVANRFLRKFGYPVVLNAAAKVRKGQNKITIRAGRRRFTFTSGRELSATYDLCGERYLRLSARILGPEKALLIHEGREYPLSLRGFGRDKFTVVKKGKRVATLYSPEPAEPIGVSANGKALYFKFFLHDEKAAPWWSRITLDQPAVMDEDPFLVIRAHRSRLYFDENIEHLAPQDFEVEEAAEGRFRWRFLPTNHVVELPSRCG